MFTMTNDWLHFLYSVHFSICSTELGEALYYSVDNVIAELLFYFLLRMKSLHHYRSYHIKEVPFH